MMFECLVAIVTPFDKFQKVNFDELKKLIIDLKRKDCKGLILTGTTGEFFSLTEEEKISIYQFVSSLKETKQMKLYANVGTNNTLETINFINKIDNLNLTGYLITTPYYLLVEQDSLYEHFKAVANQTKKEILIYNCPKRTGIDISLDTLLKLEEFENIKGIKECSNDIEKIKAMKKQLKMKIYSGNDDFLFQAMEIKLDGIISASGNVYLKEIEEIIKYKDYEKFLKYEKYFKNIFIKPNPVIIKNLLIQNNFNVGSVRLPLLDISFFELECILKKFGIKNIKL